MPKKVKEEMKIHFVESMNEVLEIALTKELPKKLRKSKIAISSELTERDEEGESSQEPPITH